MLKSRLSHIIIVIAFFASAATQAQTQVDLDLARSYMAQGEYEKALVYYQDFYDNQPILGFALPLFNCFVETQDYKSAEKLMKKEMRKHPDNLILGIELGKMFKRAGEVKKAKSAWGDAVENVPASRNEVIRIARKFSSIPEYEYALKVYEKGKRDLSDFYAFNFEIADIYGLLGQRDKMIDMYLEMLDYNPGYMQTVQNLLNRNIDFEDDTESMELLRTRLLRFIQQEPDQKLYPELLIWLYIQQRDFYGALTQVRALDRRFNEDGFRLMGLAEIAEGNEAYDVATAAYNYVIKKGDSPYYLEAKQAGLRTQNLVLEDDTAAGETEYTQLATNYIAFLNEIGQPASTAVSQRELASILARKLNNQDSALVLLNELIEIPSLTEEIRAKCRIDAGDYLVMQNNVWDAALEYMKAENAFKYDEIGERAKFKAAKVYYYTGEFGFAKGMLDVLKGSTSRLIANDALYLSQLILDNTTIDTSEVAMQIFARADLYFNQQRYTGAGNLLDSLLKEFPNHRLTDDVYFLKYKLHMQERAYLKAVDDLAVIANQYGTDILGDDAVFQLGVLHEDYLNQPKTAMKHYERILMDYPSSLYVVEARKRYRLLRGDDIQ